MAAAGCDDAATAATREESRFKLDRSSPVLIMGVPVDVLPTDTDKLLLPLTPTILPPCSLEVDPLEGTGIVLSGFDDTTFLIFPLLCMLFPEFV